MCYLGPLRRWFWKQIWPKSISDPSLFVSECPPRAFVWRWPASTPQLCRKRIEMSKTVPGKKLCPWEQLEGKPFPIYIDIIYFMIWVPTMKKRSQKCSHGKLILGGKSQLQTPADYLPAPAGFCWMLRVSGFLVLPFWHRLFFCLEASPGTRSTVNSSQLPQLLHLVSAEYL